MKRIFTSLIFILSVVTVAGQEVSILPISLKNFTVDLKNESTVEVRWDIIHQNKASGYSIEHSFDSKTWQPVGFVSQISNDSYKNFSFYHKNTGTGLHYYRIRFIQNDKKLYYSEVKIVSLKNNIDVSLWPNPTHDFVNIQCNDYESSNTSATLLNQRGLKLKEVRLIPGINKIDITKLSPGIYYVMINAGQKGNSIVQFVKQ